MTIDIEKLRAEIGRKIEDEDTATEAPLKGMIATFDRNEKVPGPGEAIAPGWHLCYLHSYARRAALGEDGLPVEGGVLPKIPLPRRMYAGSSFTFDGDIRVGDKLRRETEFTDIQLRGGGTGTLIVTTQTRRIFTSRGLAVTEAASTVFREEVKAGEKSGIPTREAAPTDVPWRRTVKPDPVMLFRYSALTFNGHRIHYDCPYAKQQEGYPGLVVHGPLMATLLVDLVRRERPDATLQSFAFKALRPIFADQPFTLCGKPGSDGKTIDLWAKDHEGYLTMRATATLT